MILRLQRSPEIIRKNIDESDKDFLTSIANI